VLLLIYNPVLFATAQVASWYRGQLFYLLAQRFDRPTPQRCGLSGQPLSILQPTALKSKELEEEVTVLPDCLCVFQTKALQRFVRPRRCVMAISCSDARPVTSHAELGE
jgi:hypothetical protein